jgi:hypothetical protein
MNTKEFYFCIQRVGDSGPEQLDFSALPKDEQKKILYSVYKYVESLICTLHACIACNAHNTNDSQNLEINGVYTGILVPIIVSIRETRPGALATADMAAKAPLTALEEKIASHTYSVGNVTYQLTSTKLNHNIICNTNTLIYNLVSKL